MKLKKCVIGMAALSLLTVQISAIAADPRGCRFIELRRAEVGTRCVTEKAFVFRLVERTRSQKEFWQDETTGLIWSDPLLDTYHWKNAARYCGQLGPLDAEEFVNHLRFYLPSQGDYEAAETHGVRDALGGFSQAWFWTSTVLDGNQDFPVFYGGSDGGFGTDFWDHYNHVRCVAKP